MRPLASPLAATRWHRTYGYGEPVTDEMLRCAKCGAGWGGTKPEPCPWCRERRVRERERMRDGALRPPDVDADASTAEVRWALEVWGERLRDAPVSREEADRAVRAWLRRMTRSTAS